ncbi:hypothetical protein EZV73_05435 [Acidaminobacter sp. JC074]|uniref:hypothetical protein n=1 Tax=Acidaminobacter sp. JC074 TaxID=2530199 RepID=UPI001F1064F2|nr:hypothetical protein [Acidaminobacter sp. JC074]MCH4886999.1 hypothetical protein [Acidaminobacter sp. JC074]
MNYTYPIKKNEAVNRWWLSDTRREPYKSPCETFEHPINTGEQYVQIVYPVRRNFLEEKKIEKVTKDQLGPYNHFYFPFENSRVEFSDFIHTPHHVFFSGKTSIVSEKDIDADFRLFTCGGVKLWLNGELVISYAPYTRNKPSNTSVTLPLKAGVNEILVYSEDLAERDVNFFFELRNVSDETFEGQLEISDDCETVYDIENLMNSFYYEADNYTEGNIKLKYDPSTIDQPVQLKIQGLASYEEKLDFEFEITKDKDCVLIPTEVLKVGTFGTDLIIDLHDLRLKKKFVVSYYKDDFLVAEESIEARKKQIIEFLARESNGNIQVALAQLIVYGEYNEKADENLNMVLKKIKEKHDCADFHIGGLAQLMRDYKDYLPKEKAEEVKRDVLNFRYWLDEPGDDVMWFFSENHALNFHIGQYLFGHMYQDEIFTVSGKTGLEQYEIGKERLIEWFEHFLKYGLGEWNSATYLPIDLIGFFALFDMAPDQEIVEYAGRALDFSFELMATYNFHGVMNASYGRIYEGNLKGRHTSGPTVLEWVTSGKGFVNFHSHSTIAYAMSSYIPPNYYDRLKLSSGQANEIIHTQGVREAKIYTYATDDFSMSSTQGFHAFEDGHQQHMMNIAMSDRNALFFINHPGEKPPSGHGRPSYIAGNGSFPLIRQYKNSMMMIYDIDDKHLMHYVHGFLTPEKYDVIEIDGNEMFIRCKDTYLYVKSSKNLEYVEYGPTAFKEVILRGLNHGIYIKVGSMDIYESYEQFKAILKGTVMCFDLNHKLTVHDPDVGILEIDGKDKFTCQGQSVIQGINYDIKINKDVIRSL